MNGNLPDPERVRLALWSVPALHVLRLLADLCKPVNNRWNGSVYNVRQLITDVAYYHKPSIQGAWFSVYSVVVLVCPEKEISTWEKTPGRTKEDVAELFNLAYKAVAQLVPKPIDDADRQQELPL
jgi:hypothetical protein